MRLLCIWCKNLQYVGLNAMKLLTMLCYLGVFTFTWTRLWPELDFDLDEVKKECVWCYSVPFLGRYWKFLWIFLCFACVLKNSFCLSKFLRHDLDSWFMAGTRNKISWRYSMHATLRLNASFECIHASVMSMHVSVNACCGLRVIVCLDLHWLPTYTHYAIHCINLSKKLLPFPNVTTLCLDIDGW
jgi:hypothetical protein